MARTSLKSRSDHAGSAARIGFDFGFGCGNGNGYGYGHGNAGAAQPPRQGW